MSDQAFPQLQPKVVLGVAAHPDDLEFGMAGSVATFVASGAKAYYLILTDACKGTADRSMSAAELCEIRRKEQRAAAKILGVSDVFFCSYEDGALEPSLDVKRDIVRVIRTVRPDVVLTMDPTLTYSVSRGIINHADHRAAGQATLDAVYPLARDHLEFPELLEEEKLEPYKVKTVLMANFDKQNFYVDISAQIDKKLQAVAAHKSQMSGPALGLVKHLAEEAGAHVGAQYAEGFVRLDLSL